MPALNEVPVLLRERIARLGELVNTHNQLLRRALGEFHNPENDMKEAGGKDTCFGSGIPGRLDELEESLEKQGVLINQLLAYLGV